MLQEISRLQTWRTGLSLLARPTPNSGRLWLDIVFLMFAAVLQQTVLTATFGSFIIVDIMTPWLVAIMVAQPLSRTAVLALVGALILETHSTVPAGLYICTCWTLAVVIYLCRNTISWHQLLPWFITFLLAELWIIGFESFVLLVKVEPFRFDTAYWLTQTGRLALATTAGIWLFRPKRHQLGAVHTETSGQ